MKEHIKKWKWLYIFYLLTISKYFTVNNTIKIILLSAMTVTLIMFCRATIERIYNNNR